ncbi:actin filament-associated protein 1-like 2 isoform X2 [Pleuronectes platessa]|uniref:actin filament-associated protein 1-like 2 isoform X2 n=1 Tax=Pleuronectes platessa TaxID=8262 RepID=UPI00232A3477|nr:actin filament-associated protein 1-like 2 isoform X2 [Pleuronectes platessa]
MRRRKRSAVVPWSDLISVCLSPVTELLLLLLLEETGAAIRTSCLHSETLFKLLILFWRGRLFGGFYARRRARDWKVKTVTVPRCERMEKHKVLDQLLMELHRFLLILDKETLSGNATVQKGLLADILHSYRASNGADEEYIYMNKVTVGGRDKDDKDNRPDILLNGKAAKCVPVPQKSLPDLPPPRSCVVGREPFPLPAVPSLATIDTSESYYEEAQPYEETVNDDGEVISSSYESYDEEEVIRGKSPSAQHQWPSTEASIELMKDSRICAFLWRKKWLGQWAKQLCVIKDHRLQCYKSSKEQTPLLDVSLLGCSVVYKEKQLKRKEHKLKITPVGGEAIVLGLQSKEQTVQWLKVIQDISPKPLESCEPQHSVTDSPRLICTKGELGERHSVASESGSSTDSHAETPENKDVKKKLDAGWKFSNLMNIGKKKPSSLESPEKCVDTSGYLNVLVNSQWRTCWCLIKNGQLWFYQDKGKHKVSQPAVTLEGCCVLPDPSPEHLYSFRINADGAQVATLEAKTSANMGHWLGLLLSQTGSKTDPEDLTYDYVNSERITSIVNAAKTSLYLMQRRYSELNTYIDTPPAVPLDSEELYDDVASLADPEDAEESILPDSEDNHLQQRDEQQAAHKEPEGTDPDKVYLDLIPVRSFLHTSCGGKNPVTKETCTHGEDSSCPDNEVTSTDPSEPEPTPDLYETSLPSAASKPEPTRPSTPTPQHAQLQPLKTTSQSQETSKRMSLGIPPVFSSPGGHKGPTGHTAAGFPHSPQPLRPKAHTMGSPGAVEVKLGKNRTEADMRRYIDERDRLEREREEVRSSLGNLKKERREAKEELSACQDPKQQASLEARLKQREEACREAEQRRVEVELRLMEVKESLRKVESGQFTLGTTLDSSLQDTPTVKSSTLPATQTSSSSSSSLLTSSSTSSLSQNSNNLSADSASPVNSASALKNRPASIMATKGKVLQKAKEWEKKSTT